MKLIDDKRLKAEMMYDEPECLFKELSAIRSNAHTKGEMECQERTFYFWKHLDISVKSLNSHKDIRPLRTTNKKIWLIM